MDVRNYKFTLTFDGINHSDVIDLPNFLITVDGKFMDICPYVPGDYAQCIINDLTGSLKIDCVAKLLDDSTVAQNGSISLKKLKYRSEVFNTWNIPLGELLIPGPRSLSFDFVPIGDTRGGKLLPTRLQEKVGKIIFHYTVTIFRDEDELLEDHERVIRYWTSKAKRAEIKQENLLRELKNENCAELLKMIQKGTSINDPLKQNGDSLLHILCSSTPMTVPIHKIFIEVIKHPKIDINIINEEGDTPLHYLCQFWRSNNMDVIDMIISCGAKTNAFNKKRETPLHKAILNTHVGPLLVNRLLKSSGNVDQLITSCDTILHYVARSGSSTTLDLILPFTTPEMFTLKGEKGKTPKDIAFEESERARKADSDEQQELREIYEKLFSVEELDIILNNQNLNEYRVLILEKGYGLKELLDKKDLTSERCSAMFTGMTTGACIKLANAINSEKDKNVREKFKINIFKKQLDLKQWIPKGEKDIPIISDLNLLYEHLLGGGASSMVYKGCHKNKKHTTTGTAVALKIFNKSSFDDEEAQQLFKQEVQSLITLDHPNIIKLYGISNMEVYPVLVLEYCDGGSLSSFLKSTGPIGWNDFFSILIQTLTGLKELHSHKIFHRDIKSENILLTSGVAKVADFGLAIRGFSSKEIDIVGTAAYIAPELIEGKNFTDKCDVYSLGIVMWEFINRIITKSYEYPFKGERKEMVFIHVHNGQRPDIPQSTPEPLVKLLQSCFHSDPEKRPSCNDLINNLQQLQKNIQ